MGVIYVKEKEQKIQRKIEVRSGASMSRVGRCIDNGPMEGFRGILKSEMYYLRKFTSRDDLISEIEHYLYFYNNKFYNNKRYQQRLKCMTPMDFHRTAA